MSVSILFGITVLLIGFGLGVLTVALVFYFWYQKKSSSFQQTLTMLQDKHLQADQQVIRLQEKNNLLEQQQNMKEHWQNLFGSLSHEILQKNTQFFQQQTKQELQEFQNRFQTFLKSDFTLQSSQFQSTLSPFQEQLKVLKEQIQQTNNTEQKMSQTLTQLHQTTGELTSTLKSSGKTRGNWGEMQLENILRLSGLQKDVDFVLQLSIPDNRRPDVTIFLPENTLVHVDSKVPMDAYLRYMQASSEQEKQLALQQHIKDIEIQIHELAKKKYWEKPHNNSKYHSLEFVFMFIPYDAGLELALSAKPELTQQAWKQKISLISPSLFLVALKIIEVSIRQTKQYDNLNSILEVAEELYNRFKVFLTHFADIGPKLESMNKTYNQAVRSYEKRLVPQLEKMQEKGNYVKLEKEPKTVDQKAELVELLGLPTHSLETPEKTAEDLLF